MDRISIILTIMQKTGSNEVEITGECEKEYREKPLYAFSADIIMLAKECKGELIPWTKEKKLEQFGLAFRFKTKKSKKEFLTKLFAYNE